MITDSNGQNVYNSAVTYSSNNISDPIVNPVIPPSPTPVKNLTTLE